MGLISYIKQKLGQSYLNKAYLGDQELLEKAIKYGADLDKMDRGGCRPLIRQVLSIHNTERGTNTLLDAGANADKMDDQGLTAIDYYVKYADLGYVDTVGAKTAKRLVMATSSAVLDRVAQDGETLLTRTLRSSDNIQIITAILPELEMKNVNLNKENAKGVTPLYTLIEFDYYGQHFITPLSKEELSALESFVKAGAKLNQSESNAFIAYSVSDAETHDTTRIILENDGLDYHYRDDQNNTLLHTYAKAYNHQTLRREIHPEKANQVLNCLLKHININVVNYNGQTPLMAALEAGERFVQPLDLELSGKFEYRNFYIKQLLKAGADVTIKDKEGRDAFDYAKETKNKEIMTFLVDNYPALRTTPERMSYMSQKSEDTQKPQTFKVAQSQSPVSKSQRQEHVIGD